MPIVDAPGIGLDPAHFLGLAIKNIGGQQQHCGLLYRVDDGRVRILHLAFHFDLRDEEYKSNYWTASAGIDTENQLVVAAYASIIASPNSEIPYGFNADGVTFDRVTGKLLEPPPGKGLTCATFVLALLRTLGFEPLETSTWPTRSEDKEWQENILSAMEASGASALHIAAVKQDHNSRRFRPEEVVAASASDSEEWRIAFEKALLLAKEVLEDMSK